MASKLTGTGSDDHPLLGVVELLAPEDIADGVAYMVSRHTHRVPVYGA